MAKVILVPLVFALLLSGCASGGAPTSTNEPEPSLAPAKRPVWTSGDHWVQRVYYEDAPNETLRTIEYVVQGNEQVSVNGRSVAALKIVSADTNRTIWVDPADSSILRESSGGTSKDYNPPCVAYPEDAKMGFSWPHNCFRIGTVAPESTPGEGFTSVAQEAEVLEVPPGALSATKIESTPMSEGPSPMIEYFAPAACFPARVVVEGERTIVMDLLTFECQSGAAT